MKACTSASCKTACHSGATCRTKRLDLRRRGIIGFAAQGANGDHHVLHQMHTLSGGRIEPARFGLRPSGDHQAFRRCAEIRLERGKERFRFKGHHRMQEAQRFIQHMHENGLFNGACFGRLVRVNATLAISRYQSQTEPQMNSYSRRAASAGL